MTLSLFNYKQKKLKKVVQKFIDMFLCPKYQVFFKVKVVSGPLFTLLAINNCFYRTNTRFIHFYPYLAKSYSKIDFMVDFVPLNMNAIIYLLFLAISYTAHGAQITPNPYFLFFACFYAYYRLG